MKALMTIFLLGGLFTWTATGSPSAAAGTGLPSYNSNGLVTAQLIADVTAVSPGRPFTVGVLLTIEPQWHIYWKNSGDSGLPTAVELKLPKGYTAGELRWPRPATFNQPGNIVGYGYQDEVLLTATVTPYSVPASAEPATITADIDWLACKEKCIKGQNTAQLTLDVQAAGSEVQPANTEIFAKWASYADPMAPSFTLMDQDGQSVSLSDFKGKVVVLEWFNPDCPVSKRHHTKQSTMTDLAAKYADKNVVWLAINSTHYMDADANRKWHEQWNLNYPVLIDQDGSVGRAYGAKTTPHMFVISEQGRIIYQGAIDDDARGRQSTVNNYVDQALGYWLNGAPVSVPQTKPYGCSVKYGSK